ncbi:MAG: methyltransferase [Prevotellaceae bacterium]|jgi:tRNA1Val (adenine37-N6)-methyltransferase|nr:methyltransferase [Prevotellaceae bacterium]
MSNSYFQFKQFTVQQSDTAMKVNTDGVLLGAWASVENVTRALDVGTGTGVIALMLAQRHPDALIDAVDIDEASAKQAAVNVQESIWRERIQVVNSSFQQFAQHTAIRYDLIVSNPPYFVNALLPPDGRRAVSRHTTALPYDDLLTSACILLQPEGRLSVILPYAESAMFMALAADKGLHCTHKVNVYSTIGKPPKRVLLSFMRQPAALHESLLTIHAPFSADYTTEYKMLTQKFYLYF